MRVTVHIERSLTVQINMFNFYALVWSLINFNYLLSFFFMDIWWKEIPRKIFFK